MPSHLPPPSQQPNHRVRECVLPRSAAALAVAERPAASRFEEDAARRLHLLHHGRPVGTSPGLIQVGGDSFPPILSGLADLRVQPLAFAHYLLAVPDETLRRSGRTLMELLREAR